MRESRGTETFTFIAQLGTPPRGTRVAPDHSDGDVPFGSGPCGSGNIDCRESRIRPAHIMVIVALSIE